MKVFAKGGAISFTIRPSKAKNSNLFWNRDAICSSCSPFLETQLKKNVYNDKHYIQCSIPWKKKLEATWMKTRGFKLHKPPDGVPGSALFSQLLILIYRTSDRFRSTEPFIGPNLQLEPVIGLFLQGQLSVQINRPSYWSRPTGPVIGLDLRDKLSVQIYSYRLTQLLDPLLYYFSDGKRQ